MWFRSITRLVGRRRKSVAHREQTSYNIPQQTPARSQPASSNTCYLGQSPAAGIGCRTEAVSRLLFESDLNAAQAWLDDVRAIHQLASLLFADDLFLTLQWLHPLLFSSPTSSPKRITCITRLFAWSEAEVEIWLQDIRHVTTLADLLYDGNVVATFAWMFPTPPGDSYLLPEVHVNISKSDQVDQVTTSDQRIGNLLPLPTSSHDQLASQAEEALPCTTPHVFAGYPDTVSILLCDESCHQTRSPFSTTGSRSNTSILCVEPRPVAVKPHPSAASLSSDASTASLSSDASRVSLSSVASTISASTCSTVSLLSCPSSHSTISPLSCDDSVSLVNFSSSDQPASTHRFSGPVPRRESRPIVVVSGNSLSRIVSHRSSVGFGSRPVQRTEAVDEPVDHGRANILSATVKTADVRVKKPLRPRRHRTAIVTA